MIKTIKLKKNEFFSIANVENLPYFLVGGRGTGKSYFVKNYIKKMLIDSNFKDKYLYVRVSKNEINTHDSWLAETKLNEYISALYNTDVQMLRGKPTAGNIILKYKMPIEEESEFLSLEDFGINNFKKVKYAEVRQHIGYVASLESSALIKSGFYEDVKVIVFEEFIRFDIPKFQRDKMVFNFLELIETVCRNRQIPIFLIANSLNAYNPMLELFKEYRYYKIFTEARRDNLTNSLFSEYLQGETYATGSYNLSDFIYVTKIKVKDKILSIYLDKYYNRDFLITDKKVNTKERIDLLYDSRINLIYRFEIANFIFNSNSTEVFFYKHAAEVKDSLRSLFERYNLN
ncbi:MAG: hypothetical protein FWC41_00765 [Firmicutes bacterium]|nr:hypothetical protein [Bacillota bacterium]